jgi:hypothetical protein
MKTTAAAIRCGGACGASVMQVALRKATCGPPNVSVRRILLRGQLPGGFGKAEDVDARCRTLACDYRGFRQEKEGSANNDGRHGKE